MTIIFKTNKLAIFGVTACIVMSLSACGGGSSGGSVQPIPIAPPAPPPPPPPPPPPATTPPPVGTNFDTTELRRSDGPGFHNAIAAYQTGATGQGVTVGIIDTGIDLNSREFTGRISSSSFDTTGAGRGAIDEDGHGTQVARIVAAAKDDRDTQGIAFNATILALRADTAGTCTTPSAGETEANCSFSDGSIAAGLNRAVDAGARVVNISLGGLGGSTSQLTSAVGRATRAGIVIVISAGNEGNDATPKYDPLNPSPFAQALLAAGNGLVIISTSVDDNGVISNFSNKAGSSQNSVLSALGSGICCEYRDDTIYRFTRNGQTFVNVSNGTSFSAPQISGAAALLAQAFPNLSGAQIVNLLLTTARDAGDAGTDTTYGRGILDIARAFSPQGTTRLAGSTIAVPLSDNGGVTSAPMGDAGTTGQDVSAVILDEYSRAYDINLAHGIRSSAPQLRLTPAITNNARSVNLNAGPANFAFSLSQNRYGYTQIDPLNLSNNNLKAARFLAGQVTLALSKDTSLSLGIRQAASNQLSKLQQRGGHSFISATDASFDNGFARRTGVSFALRRDVGGFGLSASAENGNAVIYQRPKLFGTQNDFNAYRYNGFSVAVDKQFGALQLVSSLSWLGEDKTVLGALFANSFDQKGAQSAFIDSSATATIARDWEVGASFRQGWTWANLTATISSGSLFKSNAFSFDIAKRNAVLSGDKLAFRISQPLRVTGGGLSIDVPVSYDYATETALFGRRQLSLAPKGQEITSELSWVVPLQSGSVSTNLFWRQEPGHFKNASDDMGIAFRLNLGF